MDSQRTKSSNVSHASAIAKSGARTGSHPGSGTQQQGRSNPASPARLKFKRSSKKPQPLSPAPNLRSSMTGPEPESAALPSSPNQAAEDSALDDKVLRPQDPNAVSNTRAGVNLPSLCTASCCHLQFWACVMQTASMSSSLCHLLANGLKLAAQSCNSNLFHGRLHFDSPCAARAIVRMLDCTVAYQHWLFVSSAAGSVRVLTSKLGLSRLLYKVKSLLL